MWWKILLIILAVIIFGTMALKVVSIALHAVATAFDWLAKIIKLFGFKGII